MDSATAATGFLLAALDVAAVDFLDKLFLAVGFAVVDGVLEVTSDSAPAVLAPTSSDVLSEGVVRLSGRFPEDSPPPRRAFFAGIRRV